MRVLFLRPTVMLAAALLWFGLPPARALPPTAAVTTAIPPIGPTNPATEVSLIAKLPTAYAAAGIPGRFLLTRTGSVLAALTINYQVGGQAMGGQDYIALQGTRTIPAGQSKVHITIFPLPVVGGGGSGGSVKGVRVTLLPGDGYSVSAEAKATVRIVQ